jgi:hypothetical protein
VMGLSHTACRPAVMPVPDKQSPIVSNDKYTTLEGIPFIDPEIYRAVLRRSPLQAITFPGNKQIVVLRESYNQKSWMVGG